MAFRLDPDLPMRKELHRIVRKELKAAAGVLASDDTARAVHEARKAIKKARAVLRLVRGELGRRYAEHDDTLRKAGRALSGVRDVQILERTVNTLRQQCPAMLTPAIVADVRRHLTRMRRTTHRDLPGPLKAARQLLNRARHLVPHHVQKAGGRRVVETGLLDTYRRTRRAMQALTDDSSAEEFHRWRRRAKAHWYQMRLMQARSPAAAARLPQLDVLQSLLGDAHDLEVLRRTVLGAPARFGGEHTTTILLGCIDKTQQVTHRRALRLGRRLFEARPKRFGRLLKIPPGR
jgi:CHAD domain-containing protein